MGYTANSGYSKKMGYNASGNPVAKKVNKSVLGDAKNERARNLPKLGGNNTPLRGNGTATSGKNRSGFNKMPG